MRTFHSTSKRLEPYRTCVRCQQVFENTSDNFYLLKANGPDKMGVFATNTRCKKCHIKFSNECTARAAERKKKERMMTYGFVDNYKTYDQLRAIIGAKEEPYFATEEDMIYKAPSYKEILKEYKL